MPVETIRWNGERDGHVVLIEQTLLPREERLVEIRTVADMVDAIYRLAVRGAPAIGVAAAYGILLGTQERRADDALDRVARVRECAATLAKARPTAKNLFWALERMVARAERDLSAGLEEDALVDGLFAG